MRIISQVMRTDDIAERYMLFNPSRKIPVPCTAEVVCKEYASVVHDMVFCIDLGDQDHVSALRNQRDLSSCVRGIDGTVVTIMYGIFERLRQHVYFKTSPVDDWCDILDALKSLDLAPLLHPGDLYCTPYTDMMGDSMVTSEELRNAVSTVKQRQNEEGQFTLQEKEKLSQAMVDAINHYEERTKGVLSSRINSKSDPAHLAGDEKTREDAQSVTLGTELKASFVQDVSKKDAAQAVYAMLHILGVEDVGVDEEFKDQDMLDMLWDNQHFLRTLFVGLDITAQPEWWVDLFAVFHDCDAQYDVVSGVNTYNRFFVTSYESLCAVYQVVYNKAQSAKIPKAWGWFKVIIDELNLADIYKSHVKENLHSTVPEKGWENLASMLPPATRALYDSAEECVLANVDTFKAMGIDINTGSLRGDIL